MSPRRGGGFGGDGSVGAGGAAEKRELVRRGSWRCSGGPILRKKTLLMGKEML